MGRPFASELNALSRTYDWLVRFDTKGLASIIERAAQFPLLACGSGGSITAATLAVALHQSFTRNLSKVATPLEMVTVMPNAAEIAVCIISAGGKNRDVIAAFNKAVRQEPPRLSVICSTTGSPLGKIARRFPFVDLLEFDNPAGRDGFLATNSLFAFSGLLVKAYSSAFANSNPFATSFEEFAFAGCSQEEFLSTLQSRFKAVLERRIFIVLFTEATRAAAVDLESKFTEAGLGAVQMADYRNFAHGRHHWLAKHSDDSAVIAFTSPDDESLARKTLALLPSSIPIDSADEE